jgi:4-amino-4-deoxy-L-arabinose transferase-like glycosyltransferase
MNKASKPLARQERYRTLLIVLTLTIIAAIPRFYNLGYLSFSGDEETTSMASRSLAEGNAITLPSGMPYPRARLQSWANALSAKAFGLNLEFSYRFPAATLGTLSVPLVFLLVRSFFGTSVALLTAILLALSEWHILVSRTARMYAPFLFFYLTTGFAAWRWAISGVWKYFFAFLVLFFISVELHALGIFAVFFVLAPLGFIGLSKVKPVFLIAASVVAAISAHLYLKLFVEGTFEDWKQSAGEPYPFHEAVIETTWLQQTSTQEHYYLLIVGALIGLFSGILLALKNKIIDAQPGALFRKIGLLLFATLTGVMAGIGQLYGAAILGSMFLVLHPANFVTILRNALIPSIIIIGLGFSWLVVAIMGQGVIAGIKSVLVIPFPYMAYFADRFPGIMLLFTGIVIYLVTRSHHPRDLPLRVAFFTVVIPFFTIGILKQWGGIRYLIETYPLVLVLAASGLITVVSLVGNFTEKWGKQVTVGIGVIIVASGVLGGHGIPQAIGAATLKHGERIADDKYYPDHKLAGEYVRDNKLPQDIIIAEDPLEQYWYIGIVHYWLRTSKDHENFLYYANDGQAKDIYVSSVLATIDILNSICTNTTHRAWVITSGETYTKRDYYLSVFQQKWLARLEETHKPVKIGRDGITKVYVIDCSDPSKKGAF